MPGLCRWDLLDRNGLCARSILVPGYFLLLRRMAQCIGKVLGPRVRGYELRSHLHCSLGFLILASLSCLGVLIFKIADFLSSSPFGADLKSKHSAACDFTLQTVITTQRCDCSDSFISKVSSSFTFYALHVSEIWPPREKT